MPPEKILNKKVEFYSQKFAKNLFLSERLKKVLSIFKGHHFNRLLDIGCGDGSFSVILKDFAKEVYGIDIAKTAVETSKKKGIKAVQVDIDEEGFPFENNYFDAVFAGEIIEHLHDTDNILDEIYRVSKPKGLCVITTPNLAAWYNRFLLLLGFQPHFTGVSLRYNVGKLYIGKMKKNSIHAVGGHISVFTYRSLRELLELHNFYIENVLGTNLDTPLPFYLNFFDKIVCRKVSLATYLIFAVRKVKEDTES